MLKKFKYFLLKTFFKEHLAQQQEWSRYNNEKMTSLFESKINYILENIDDLHSWDEIYIRRFIDAHYPPGSLDFMYEMSEGSLTMTAAKPFKFPDSSEVEQMTVNHSVAGSNPALGAK